MLLSVVTINLNNCWGLKRTLRSLSDLESSDNIEVIVQDGLSSDGSNQAAKAMVKDLPGLAWYSEADEGIADAWNRGIRRASGTHVALLNAGDLLIQGTLWPSPCPPPLRSDWMAAASVGVGTKGIVSPPRRLRAAFLPFGLGLLHPGFMAPRSLYGEVGPFNNQLRFAADCDWIIRAHRHGARLLRSTSFVWMDPGGISNIDPRTAWNEYAQVLSSNQIRGAAIARIIGGLIERRDRLRREPIQDGHPNH